MSDEEIISIAVKTSLLNYIDNETPRRFFVSGHAELDDVVNFGRVIAATAFEKASNVMGAEVERLRAALISARDFANSERRNTALLLSNPPQSSAAWNIRNHIDAALGEEKKG